MAQLKVAKVLWLWPEIAASLDAGWKLKDIWRAALQHGIQMTYKQFTVDVCQTRRKKKNFPHRIERSVILPFAA